MLELYFARPRTVDRIRASWIAEPIERYVGWMHESGYAPSTVQSRVPVLVRFGEFAARHGARSWEELPEYVVPFLRFWQRRHRARFRSPSPGERHRCQIQKPVEEMIERVLPGFERSFQRPQLPAPFATQAPGFFSYLRKERGLREATMRHYIHYLRRFERYLTETGRPGLQSLSPKLLRDFIERASGELSTASVMAVCGSLRVLLQYLYREQILARDLSPAVEHPRPYRLAKMPRSIPWEDTRGLLEQIDRRSAVGRRDFALLLLLVTYGLRAKEVASLTLDDVDWRSQTIRISARKGGHTTHYRLTAAVGEALAEYIEHVRPHVGDRHIFFRLQAPVRPLRPHVVSHRASHWLKQAGISVPRAGSHTLRHTVVQHLLDHGLSLERIGDYVGHRSPDSTQIYAKADIRHLREIALGYGEEVL